MATLRISVLFTFLLFIGSLIAQNPLPIPSLLTGPEYDLILQKGTKEFFSGIPTTTMGVNGDILGPTLVLNAGETVKLNVQNNLGEPSTIHWHGLHVHPANDGGPHTVIENGTTWSPQFEVLDKAGTYCYHPHLHMKTAEHVTKGIAGFIIVRDDEESKLLLPRTYGLDDIPLVIQSRAFDTNKQFLTLSALDNTILVNCTIDPYVEVPAQVVRLRLLNGSTERVYRFGFEGDHSFHLIGTDGGLLPSPVTMTRLNLSPGERIEILVDLMGMENSSIFLKSFASELSNGTYGADNPSIMPMGSIQGYASNPLNGQDFEVLRLDIIQQTNFPVLQIPTTLVNDQPFVASQANMTRSLTFQAAQMNMNTMVNGPFVINGSSFNLQTINYQIPINNIEIWELTNMTAIAHPFHIHDVQFYILDINGNPPPAHLSGRKDVVLVPPGNGTVRFIAQFSDFSDPVIPYMYHCHMLSHEDAGMMGQFLVTGGTTSIQPGDEHTFQFFPNPTNDYLTVVLNSDIQGHILLTDHLGRSVKGLSVKHIQGNTLLYDLRHLPTGAYWIQMASDNGSVTTAKGFQIVRD